MSFSGMDLEAVLRHARTLEYQGANELFNVITDMQRIVPQLMDAWHGDDANNFAAQWGHHSVVLNRLHSTLSDVAASVARAAQAQHNISGS